MSFELQIFDDPAMSDEFLAYLLDQEALDAHIHFSRLWDYYRNPLLPGVGVASDALNLNSHPYFQAQEAGLPARITGVMRLGVGGEELACAATCPQARPRRPARRGCARTSTHHTWRCGWTSPAALPCRSIETPLP